MVKVASTEEFNKLIEHGTCLIKIGMPTCGPCNLTQKNIESIESEYPDVKFIEVNAEETEDLVESLNIRSVPVVIKCTDAQEETRHNGLATVDKLREILG